eukprot:8844137-Ditylum_brightwellii.AAC.1
MILTEHDLKYSHQNHDVCSIRQKLSQMHRKKPGTGNPKIPPHIQDAKLTWYQMRQKAELSTGMPSDDENISFFQENRFDSIPNEITKHKKLNMPSVQDIIELPDSDSDSDSDSSAFMTRPPFKKIKQESSININTIIRKEVIDDDAKPKAAVVAGLVETVTVVAAAMAKTDKTKRDLSGVMMFKPSNNTKKKTTRFIQDDVNA